jgi:hypothetical protein
MNKAEARTILATELSKLRELSYEDLVAMVDLPKRTIEMVGPSATRYYIDLVVYWDREPGGDVRVIGSIDDGGWTSFVPTNDSFIKAAAGSFVDEDSDQPLRTDDR